MEWVAVVVVLGLIPVGIVFSKGYPPREWPFWFIYGALLLPIAVWQAAKLPRWQG